MKKALHNIALGLTVVAGLVAFIPTASAAGVFDTFQSSFQSLSQGWFGTAQGYANDIFYTLLTVDFVWFALTWVIARKTFDEALPSFIRKVMVYGFFLALLVNAGTWLPAIVNGFTQMGTSISGVPAMTPSTLVDTGDALAYGVLTGDYSSVQKYVPGAAVPAAPAQSGSGSTCTWYTLCLNKAVDAVSSTISSGLHALEFFLVDLLFAGITWVSFLMLAIDLLITLIEAYVVLGVGVVFLGFGASRWTTKFADGILNYAVSVGVKLMMLYLVIGALITAVVPSVVSQLMANASGSGAGALNSLLMGGAGVVLMLMLGKSVPSKAQSLLSGAAALGAAHAMQEATGGVRGGAAAALGVGGLALAGARGAQAAGSGLAGFARRAVGGSISAGGGGGGGGGGNAIPAVAAPAAKASSQGVEAAGNAAGAGIKTAGQTAGSAIAAIPVPGVAQAAGAAVAAASTAAGTGAEMAGKGISAAGKTAQSVGEAARASLPGSAAVQGTESGSPHAPAGGGLKPAAQQSQGGGGSNPLLDATRSAGRAAGMVTQHPGGAVQAGHISTGHGND